MGEAEDVRPRTVLQFEQGVGLIFVSDKVSPLDTLDVQVIGKSFAFVLFCFHLLSSRAIITYSLAARVCD